MPSLSFAGGVDASYEVGAGKTSVVISSNSQLNVREAYVGTGQMIFRWVSTGKTQTWQCEHTMLQPTPVQPTDVSEGGVHKLMVEMGDLFPAGFLLQGRMVGTLMAPAVHLDIPWWQDVWVFLIRSPWYPLKLQLAKPVLTVTHGASRATASLGVSGANLSAQVAIEGPDYKNATLELIRVLGLYKSQEYIGQTGPTGGGSEVFGWNPIARAYDLVLVTHHSINESQLAQVAAGLGAQESGGFFGPGSVQGDFVLCDGPAFGYTLAFKGHRGLLENDEDESFAKLTW